MKIRLAIIERERETAGELWATYLQVKLTAVIADRPLTPPLKVVY
jgi:hypothetical protein